jgi:AraC-like DNA-binding protein
MPGSLVSVFGGLDDFGAALRSEGVIRLLVTEQGQFRGRLTRIALDRLCLTAGEEQLSRIAFVVVQQGVVLASFPVHGAESPVWGGTLPQRGEIVTIGPGERLHARTAGPCRWSCIQIPHQELVQCGRVLAGSGFMLPPGIARWRPAPAAGRQLHQLYRAALRVAESRSSVLADAQAAHGLEQQLLHALVECLWPAPVAAETPTERRHREALAGFEDVLEAGDRRPMRDICAALAMSERLLRHCCATHLGLSPSDYRRRQAMQHVRRALCDIGWPVASVSAVAKQHGFRDLGRFAAAYRELYGESPSATLRRRLVWDTAQSKFPGTD